MKTIQFIFFTFLVSMIIISPCLFGQEMNDSVYHAIPIEAYDGYDKDTFTLIGESEPRKVFKVGEYNSTVKVNLKDVGEVFVHHVLGNYEEGYPYVEMYSRKPSSEFIKGIERYGHYRMLTRQAVKAEDLYNGDSRIEFVNGLNRIVRTINPRKAFTINGQKEMLWEEDNGDITRVSFTLRDCRKYVDTVLYDRWYAGNVDPDCTFSGFIQYEFYNEVIKLSLHVSLGGEEPNGLKVFESVIYDSLGQIVLRVDEAGSVNSFFLTADHEYAYLSGGGAYSENSSLPFSFKIVKLKTGEVLLERSSTDVRHHGWTIAGTNLGVYQMEQNSGAYGVLESYVIDHDRNLMYPIHLHPLCQAPFNVAFYTSYCECIKSNLPRTKLYYEKDFMIMPFNK